MEARSYVEAPAPKALNPIAWPLIAGVFIGDDDVAGVGHLEPARFHYRDAGAGKLRRGMTITSCS